MMLLVSQNCFSQKQKKNQEKFELIGAWNEGICSTGETDANRFIFRKNGSYQYIFGQRDPNPINTINGNYKIIADSGGGGWLILNIVSYKAYKNYEISAEAPDENRFGIFGFSGEKERLLPHKDHKMFRHKFKIMPSQRSDEDHTTNCQCFELDGYRYYKVPVIKQPVAPDKKK